MRIASIRLKNFRAFREVHMRDIPGFCVLIGANGTGKSTLFSVFSFLRDAMTTNVTAALGRLGGSRGIQEVRSRGSEGAIEIELKIRADLGRPSPSLITYSLEIQSSFPRGLPATIGDVRFVRFKGDWTAIPVRPRLRKIAWFIPGRGGGPPRHTVDGALDWLSSLLLSEPGYRSLNRLAASVLGAFPFLIPILIVLSWLGNRLCVR